jgi:hypothetical protein
MSLPISVQLYNPHLNQSKIHDAINNEPYKYYVLDIGRQFGKSLLATNQALYWLLNDTKFGVVEVAWVSPIYNQANKVYEQVVKAFAETSIITKKDGTKLKIEFSTGSTLQFFSAERYDNIRGFTFDYLICDEFAFMDSEAWTEVLRATVLVKGKKVLLISTPKGKNHFWQLHQLDGVNPQYKSFTMTSYDNPLIDPKEIDDARITLPDHVFRQEYLGDFIDGGAGLFQGQVIREPLEQGIRFFAGVDVGRNDDYTVLCIFNQSREMVYIERWRHDTWANISKKVADKINEYNAVTLVEVNSIGDAIMEQIQTHCRTPTNVQPFVTTSKSKQDIIEKLAVSNQNKEVTFKPCDWLEKEFSVFTYEYNPKSRSVKYGAPSGFHDDGVMATAIAFDCITKGIRQDYSIRA